MEYSDPFIPTFPKMREHHFDLNSVPLTQEALSGYDCVVLSTDHDSFDYDLIRSNAQLVVDTRGVYRGRIDNVIKA